MPWTQVALLRLPDSLIVRPVVKAYDRSGSERLHKRPGVSGVWL